MFLLKKKSVLIWIHDGWKIKSLNVSSAYLHFLFFSTMSTYHFRILIPFLLLASTQCDGGGGGGDTHTYSSELSSTDSLLFLIGKLFLFFFLKTGFWNKIWYYQAFIFLSEYRRLQTVFIFLCYSGNPIMTLYHFVLEFLLWSKNSPKMKDLQGS